MRGVVSPSQSLWQNNTLPKGSVWSLLGCSRKVWHSLFPRFSVTGGEEMELTPANKSYIDSLPYFKLLERYRYAPAGDPMFQGETGDYWTKRMQEKIKAGADHVRASKAVDAARESQAGLWWKKPVP